MKTHCCRFLPFLVSISAACAGPIEDAEALLQRQQFKEAAAALPDAALTQAAQKGYARYLRAVALAEAKQFAAAITDCEAIPAGDEWQRKALFLKAQCLAELKRHQEAEAIYSAESARLFATTRQEKLAEALVSLAQEITKPAAPGQSITPEARLKALSLYQKAVELETGPVVRENLLFEVVALQWALRDFGKVRIAGESYLLEFDPDWTGAPGKPKAREAGKHRWEVRARMIEAALWSGSRTVAVGAAEQLLTLWQTKPPAAGSHPDAGDIEWLLCRAHGPMAAPFTAANSQQAARQQRQGINIQQQAISFQANANFRRQTLNAEPNQQAIQNDVNGLDPYLAGVAGDQAKQIEAIRAFLKKYPNHPRSLEAGWTLVRVLEGAGKREEAIVGCKAVYERADWPAPAPAEGDVRGPAERIAAWKQEAFFKEGQLRFALQQYPQAIEQWRAYITRHPDGSLWQSAQASIVEAEFQLCLEAVAAGQREEATKRFDAFIAAHPLDARCAQLLFLNGQWHYAAALAQEKGAEGKPRTKEHLALYESAIAEWARLIVKHPQSNEASLALYRTGVIQTDVLAKHEEALATFERLTWGGWHQLAAERAKMMPQKSLALQTPRTFRTNEAARVRVNTRNIEKLKVARYTLNLEDYFRGRHRLDGENGVGSLDIDLIQPDKSWEVTMEGYGRLKPLEQDIAVPFDGAKPGVCIVRVEGDDWQASTIVNRSDIDVIVQAAWTEALVFVQDRVKGAVVADAEVLISNGKEIIGQGRTGADGVFRLRGEFIRSSADLCVFVRTPAGEAIQQLNLRGMTQEITGGDPDRKAVTPSQRGFIYTDKFTYQPGETVHFRGIIRDVAEGAYTVPVGREYEVRVEDEQRRVLQKTKVKLGEFGSFTEKAPLPSGTPFGLFSIVVRSVEGKEVYRAPFQVREYSTEEIAVTFETKPEPVYRGDHVEGTVRLRYSWGAALADEPIILSMPDGRKLEGRTNADGAFAFTQETTGFQPGQFLSITADLPARNRKRHHAVPILRAGTILAWDRVPLPALAGEPAAIRVKATNHKGEPTAATVKVTVSRKPDPKINDVLGGLPGLRYIPKLAAPVKVEELTVQTDPATGLGEVRPTMKDAVAHVVTAQAVDARGNPSEIRTDVAVSGGEDPQKLLLFTESDDVVEGAALKVDAFSRVAAPLALVTFAGESMVEHRVVPLAAGHNEVAVTVAAAHWPQFDVSVACLDGQKLHQVRRCLVVKRPLKIEIQTPAQPPKPGNDLEITLTTKDGQGKPVAAELSLALASAQLFAQFPDECTGIETYFGAGLRARGSMRTNSSAAFSHRGQSRVLTRDESGNASAPAAVAESHVDRALRLQALEQDAWLQQGGTRLAFQSQGQSVNGLATNGAFDFQTMDGALGESLSTTEASLNIRSGFSSAQEFQTENFDFIRSPSLKDAASPGKPWAPNAVWICPIVTDATGKATVKVTSPAMAGVWRLMSKGCTKNTSVGEAKKNLLTKDDFLLTVNAPAFARPGDSTAPRASAFGALGGAKDAKATLQFRAGPIVAVAPADISKQERKVTFSADGVSTVQFEPITIPRATGSYVLTTTVQTAAPQSESKFARLLVLPSDDLEEQHSAKVFAATGTMNLPAQPRERAIVRLFDSPLELVALMGQEDDRSQGDSPQTAASRLLGAASALRAIRGSGANVLFPQSEATSAIAELQITQQDGGWTWQGVKWDRDSVVTSTGLWALVEARALGFTVEEAAIKKATTYLKSALVIIPPDEPDKAAVILHALATVNEADFSVANRLYRDRAKLNDPALAYLAAAFQRMERIPEAQEILKLLEGRAEWKGSATTGRLSRLDDTNAIILYAAARTAPGSPLAKRAAEALLPRLGVHLGAHSPLRGIWTAAFAEHFIGTDQHKLTPAGDLQLSVNATVVRKPQSEFLPGSDAKNPTRITFTPVFLGGPGNEAFEAKVSFTDGAPILLATSVGARAIAANPDTGTLPTIAKREWLHAGLRHRDLPLKARSTSPVTTAEFGQRLRVRLLLRPPQKAQTSYVVIDEPMAAGCQLIANSLVAPHDRLEEVPGKLRLWFAPGTFAEGKAMEITYDLVALHPGAYGIPATQIFDACRTERRLAGPAGKLTILTPANASPDPYVINREERLELAGLLFNENKLEEARTHLEILRADAEAMKNHEREIARMLLWAQTARNPMDAKQVVELFEALSERHPDLLIPFDRILKVAEAYRLIGEFERAWLVYRATLESAFVRDAGVSERLETNGDFPGSVDHLLALWREYPDAADVSLAFFHLGQSLQEKSATAATVPVRPGAVKPTKTQLLERSRDLLRTFVTLRSKDDLADDASFNLANVYFELKDYASVVKTAGTAATVYTKSPFANSFHYMTALGYFWQYQFPQALAAAAPVAAGASDDASNARYITAQIYHAQEKNADAIQWYEKVRADFDDAAESLKALQEKGVKLPPATNVKPGEAVKLELGHRNVKEAALKIYRVDLLKLHDRQKDLNIVSGVNLSGITPEAELSVPLGDGLDYAWKKRAIELPMKQEGAYLVICRGDSQMTSGLVLITTLALEVKEDADDGAVRVQVRDTAKGNYVAEAEIAAYDSTAITQPQKGRTDPRGAFSAADIHGYATVAVKLGDTRYAYYRSATTLRPLVAKQADPNPALPAAVPQKPMKTDYLMNVRGLNESNLIQNKAAWGERMKEGKGVKAEKAFKK